MKAVVAAKAVAAAEIVMVLTWGVVAGEAVVAAVWVMVLRWWGGRNGEKHAIY